MINRRYIAHVDMDAFFAAIEQRDNPVYRGKPVVVGADPKGGKGRGVVSTCSYEARRFGIHSAMPISIAYLKCPEGVFLPVDMEKYAGVSREIYRILYDFTPDIEPVSIDEAFLDISGSHHLFGDPLKTCQLIKEHVKSRTGLTASVGLAPTKMAAKIASDLKKPDGLVEVCEEKLLDFLWPLDIRKIWGLGEKSEEALREAGINTIGDIAKKDVSELISLFGKNGEEFWRLANGIDEREIETDIEAKSISNETTFEQDTFDKDLIASELLGLSEEVSDRLRHEGFKARTITLKIRLEGFKTYTRSTTFIEATNFVDVIYGEIKRLFVNFDRGAKKVRLVGVKASNLLPAGLAQDLFRERLDEKRENVSNAVDRIKDRFGSAAIFRAGARGVK